MRTDDRNKKDDELKQTESSLEENINTLQNATQKVGVSFRLFRFGCWNWQLMTGRIARSLISKRKLLWPMS